MPTEAAEEESESLTGVALLDELAAAIASGDEAEISARVHLTSIPCSNADGLGGPPPCPEGVAEGTPLDVLPIVESHLTYGESLRLDAGPLEAVYEAPLVTSSVYAFPELDIDWPVARYVFVYPNLNPNISSKVSLLVTAEGEVMRVVHHFPPAENVIPQGAVLLYSAE